MSTGGDIGIAGEEADGFGRDVGGVDSGVGADEAVVCLSDQDAAFHPHDPDRFAQDDLDLASVLLVAAGPLDREGRRLDRAKVDQLTFGLADDLVGDDNHIAVSSSTALVAEGRVAMNRIEVIAGLDFGDAVESDDLDCVCGHEPVLQASTNDRCRTVTEIVAEIVGVSRSNANPAV